jgi:hypothetical protein
MDSETITYVILGTTGAIILGAYSYLILVPAWTAYGRNWERLAAAVLSLFVLAAFAGSGLGVGLLLVYYWDTIIGIFNGNSASVLLETPRIL